MNSKTKIVEENVATPNKVRLSTKDQNTISCAPKLVCIQYPGVVNDTEKAIQTLGGISEIEIATSNFKKNLELRFSTKDYYRKPCLADRDLKPSIVVKIKTKHKVKDGKVVEGSEEVVDYDVVGVTALSFKFNKLCDFQYLPLVPKKDCEFEDELEYIYNKILPDELPDADWITSEETENMQFYFPPPSYSKFNSTNNMLHFDRSKFYEGRFTPEYYKKFKEQELQQKIDRKDKNRHTLGNSGFFCNFDDEIPLAAPQFTIERLAIKFTTADAVLKLKNLFEQRPIWSKLGLLYESQVSQEQIKFILPTLAFYYVSGPWRVMWVRFGYDPRKDPSSKLYQTFDYRVRARGGFKLKVKPKRSYTSSIYRDKKSRFSLTEEYRSKSSQKIQENAFRLKPGTIPSARQMFYQYCDIYLPEIEAMIARLPPLLPGAKCHKKNGWLPSGFTEQCREIANKYIGAQVLKELQEDRGEYEETVEPESSAKDVPDEQSEPDEFFEISDTSSSSSESEDESAATKQPEDLADSENEIDMETVEEVNRIINMSKKTNKLQHEDIYSTPGCSKFT